MLHFNSVSISYRFWNVQRRPWAAPPLVLGDNVPPTHERCRGQGGTGKNWNTRLLHCHLMHERMMSHVVINSYWSVKFEIRLLLVNPASSATAERSFSSLRRLKTYLRSTCGQRRLNDIALCHIHKDIVDEVDTNEVMKQFIHARDSRVIAFGHV